MTPYIPLLVYVTAVSVLLNIFFWCIVRPILLNRANFRLFARRDKLRRMALEEEVCPYSHAYQSTEVGICKIIEMSSRVSLRGFLHFAAVKGFREAKEEQDDAGDLPREIMRIRQGATRDALLIMALNSPMLSTFACVVLFVFWLLGMVTVKRVVKKAEVFVDHQPPPHHGLLSAS